ncbi:hypothetical protein ACHHYP_16700 [Achlya hypogyna]|uniref:Uncharacterized protein n=1 Tax=Achlya hypogyna TaxID=1202772 RepID=A0A1V9Y633_ACHHY|nr:hypothetical protein ACHHYP_16700 [Achlya hypogyna]
MEELIAGFEWRRLFKAVAGHLYAELKLQLRTNDEWIGRAAAFVALVLSYRLVHIVCHRRSRKGLQRAPSRLRAASTSAAT